MVAWDEPIRSKRSEEFEAAGGGPKAGCEPLMSSTAGCGALPKSSPPEATGPDGAWLKALQSPKSPFPLVAWEGKLPDAAAELKSANPPNKSAAPPRRQEGVFETPESWKNYSNFKQEPFLSNTQK